MSQETVNLTLRVRADDAGINKAKAQLARLKSQQTDLAKAFLDGKKSADEFTRELADTEKQARRLTTALKQVEQQSDSAAISARKAASGGAGGKDIGGAGGKDIGGALGGIGGALGSLGGATGISQLGDLGNLASQVEQVGKLKEGLTATGSAAGALGATLAVGAGAFIGYQIGVALFGQGIKDAADAITRQVDAQRALNQELIRSGTTSDDLKARLELNNQLREDEQRRLNDLQSAYAEFEQKAGLLSGVIKGGFLGEGEEALFQQIEASKANLQSLGAEASALGQALDSSIVAANDMKRAEQELAQERSKAALEAGQTAAALETARLDGIRLSEEERKKRIQQNEDTIRIAQAELSALQASGEKTAEVTNRIAQLTQQISILGQSNTILAQGTSSRAIAEQRATQVTKERETSERQLTSALQQTTSAAGQTAKSLQDANKEAIAQFKADRSSRDAARKARENARRQQREERRRQREQEQREIQSQQDDLNKARIDYYNNEVKAAIDQNRKIEDLRRNAQQSERDALRSGDIFAIRDIRERLAFDQESARIEESRRASDASAAFRQQTQGIIFNITNADPQQTAYIVQQQLQATLLR
jgi:DNA repair exonuclease SbcCD ATPase subunit